MAVKRTKAAPDSCGACKYGHKVVIEALVCFAHPMVLVVDGKPLTIRPGVQPSDPACVDYKRVTNA